MPLVARPELADRVLTYEPPGFTAPGSPVWPDRLSGFRCFERAVAIGSTNEAWDEARSAVLRWQVKLRSGFRVERPVHHGQPVVVGERSWLHASLGPLRVREPVCVVDVVDEPGRYGFAYGTLEGHPVSGEEAFVVHRDRDGTTWFTLRSAVRPAPSAWRFAFPLILVAQRVYRRRYLRSLATTRRVTDGRR